MSLSFNHQSFNHQQLRGLGDKSLFPHHKEVVKVDPINPPAEPPFTSPLLTTSDDSDSLLEDIQANMMGLFPESGAVQPNDQKEEYVFSPFEMPLDPRLNPKTTLLFARLTEEDREEMRKLMSETDMNSFDFSFSLDKPSYE
jgi:hypothetical protein